jgi:hypothetical protein
MTGLIAIDESGDLGSHGTRYFAIAAIVMLRPRNLKKAADLLPKDSERKWHNSLPQVREEVLSAMSDLRFNAVYTVVDKNNPSTITRYTGTSYMRKSSERLSPMRWMFFNAVIQTSFWMGAGSYR